MKKSKREKELIETSREVSTSLFYLTLFLVLVLVLTGGVMIYTVSASFAATISAFLGQNIYVNITLLSILLSLAFANLIISFDKYERKLKQVIHTVIGGVFPLAILIIVALKEILILPIVVVFTALFIVIFKLVK